jgi:cytochrome b561
LLLHRSAGLAILAAMLFRAFWRWRHPPPALPPKLAAFERVLAGCTHAALYVVFIGMPLAGYVNTAAAGHAVSFFWDGLDTAAPSRE